MTKLQSAHTRIEQAFRDSHTKFTNSLFSVQQEQEAVLARILQNNQRSQFGQAHQFSTIQTGKDFRARVPLFSYEDYESSIEKIQQGEQSVLTESEVLLLEPTSGTSGATKLIPYTEELRKEFESGIAPWIYELYQTYPELKNTYAYWSVSPSTTVSLLSKIPIGFPDDTAYFSKEEQESIRETLAVPPEVRHIEDTESFWYVTLLFLLREKRLGLISIWNPTYLRVLFKPLQEKLPELIKDIREGTLSVQVPANVREKLQANLRRDAERAQELQHSAALPDAEFLAKAFPRLQVISCWADARAADSIGEITKLFPQVQLQAKGLIATEGFISLPSKDGHSVLAVRSHFYEFIEVNTNKLFLAHQLEAGKQYAVVITTAGGLYRYQLHDIIEVHGRLQEAPLITFIGKEKHLSDYVGEKVSAVHIERALQEYQRTHALPLTFFMMAPERDGAVLHYTLYVEGSLTTQDCQALLSEFTRALGRNYHYLNALRLGQLQPLKLFQIRDSAAETYLRRQSAAGRKLGDIKPTVLSRETGWSHEFRGEYVS